MIEVFGDTFYWLALINGQDPQHQSAMDHDLQGRAVVTSWAVLIEVMDALSKPAARPFGTKFWSGIHARRDVKIIELDCDLLERSVDLFAHRLDKAWPFTDCISFTIMQDRGITLALTADQHFEQAGFEIAFK